MASLFKQLGETISANIKNEVDKRQDPVIMGNYYYNKAEEEHEARRNKLASVIAARKVLEQDVLDMEVKISKMNEGIKLAKAANCREDVEAFVVERRKFEGRLAQLKTNLEASLKNEEKLQNLYDKETEELEQMKFENETILANAAIADTQKSINETESETGKARVGFKKMREKAKMTAAIAETEADILAKTKTPEKLEAKYFGKNASVQAEVDAIMAE